MIYSNPQALDMPDVNAALFAFIATYGLPSFDEKNIFRGYQNTPLPKKSNEFCVFHVLGTERKGTNHKTRIDANLQRVTQEYVIATVQVDFYSQKPADAMARAQMFSVLARDNIAVEFFKTHKMSPLYSSDVKNLSYMDEGGQYVQRFSIEMRLGYWVNMGITVESFENAAVTHLKNVDVFYQP